MKQQANGIWLDESFSQPGQVPGNLPSEDVLAAELSMSLDSQEKKDLYVHMVHAKWNRKGWLNGELVEKGVFPKLETFEAEKNMALILENQRKFQKLHERRIPVVTGADGKLYADQSLSLDTTTADEALPTTQVMPIIRRVYAKVMMADFQRVQPLAGPTGYAFWLDFIRETDSTNIMSVEYNAAITAELGVPQKGKLKLSRAQLNAVKQAMGLTWSLESEEDAMALLNMNVETELMAAFTNEFVRNIFARHLQAVNAASTGAAVGVANLGGTMWAAANPTTTIPARGATAMNDYKAMVYNSLLDADTEFIRRNRVPSNAIIAGLGLSGFLRKLFTATGSTNVSDDIMSSVGLSNYGTYEGRWTIWGTEFLPENAGFLYRRSPDALYAGHIYAPYVPLMATPRIYADYDPVTGNYQNKDAYTRNLRERSADLVTKAYAFMPITASTLTF